MELYLAVSQARVRSALPGGFQDPPQDCSVVALDLGHVLLVSFSLSTFVPTDGPAAYPIPVQNIKPLLTVSFTSGDISLMNNYDDLSPTVIRSGLKGTAYDPRPRDSFSRLGVVRPALVDSCPLQ